MIESTQAATSTKDLVMTLLKFWDLYHTELIVAFIILLLATFFFLIRKSSLGKWLLLLTIFTGLSIIMLDQLKLYVSKRRKAALANALLAPVNQVGRLVKGLFGFGR